MLSLCSRCFCTKNNGQKREDQSTEGSPGSASQVAQEGAPESLPLQTLTTDFDTHQRAALGINKVNVKAPDVDKVKLKFQLEDEKKQNLLNSALLQIIQRRICKVFDVIPSTDDSLKLSEDLKGLITFHMDAIMQILDKSCSFELSQNLLEELNDSDNGIILSQVVDYHPNSDIRKFLKSLDSSKGLIHLLNQAECGDQIEKVRSDLAENTTLISLIAPLHDRLCFNDPLTTESKGGLAAEAPDPITDERDHLAAEESAAVSSQNTPSVMDLIADIQKKLDEEAQSIAPTLPPLPPPSTHSKLCKWKGDGQDKKHKAFADSILQERLLGIVNVTGTVDNERSKELMKNIEKFKSSMDGYLSLIDKTATPANLKQLRAHLNNLEESLHPIMSPTKIDSASNKIDFANKMRDLLMVYLKELNPALFSEQVSLDGVVAVIRSDYEKKSSSVR